MRKLMLGAVLALVLPVAAIAQADTPSPTALATKACNTEKAQMGTQTFKKTYGTKAMKACRAKAGVAAENQIQNAAQACRAEKQAMTAEAFAQKYAGVNHNGKNAFGKCVSTNAKAASEQRTENRVEAADTCKAMDKAAFEATFGTKKNAFGKCVSATAKELAQTES